MNGHAINKQITKKESFSPKGHGYVSACGGGMKEAFKGWITITDDIPKGTRIHVLAYKKQFGLSMQLGKPKINTTGQNENKFKK